MQPERAWLDWVGRAARRSGGGGGSLQLGIGDDAALIRLRPAWELAVTTDLLIEDVHFLRRRDPAASCGRRLATRALSDLAAMGAEPLALLVSSAYPAGLPVAWPRQMVRGLLEAAREAGAALAGGDAAASPAGCDRIFLDVVGLGQAPAGGALRRSGARPGDRIYVSGRLGEASRGRALVHRGRPARTAADRRARRAHLHPRARWELGQALRRRATSAMDLSDGLALDLHRLCRASGAGAEIYAERLPAPPGVAGLQHALAGGEDYELLFTLPRGLRPPRGHAVTEIGVITAGRGVWLHRAGGRERLPGSGWEHWA